jgi:hypothetical protein
MALLIWAFAAFSDSARITVNGREVHGEEREQASLGFKLFIFVPGFLFLFHARRLLPGSPFDFIEAAPAGLTVSGLLGRRYRPWQEIRGFSSGYIIFTSPTVYWITTDTEPPMRFTMGGYVRFRFFSSGKADVQAIADWLDRIRNAYIFGGNYLPEPPEELAGRIVTLTDGNT